MSGILGAILAQSGPVITVSYVTQSTSTTASITLPASLQDGDVGVLFDSAVNNSSPDPTTAVPSGWTSRLNTPASSDMRAIISTKILSASDSSTSITGMAGSKNVQKILQIYRGDVPITTITAGSFFGEYLGGSGPLAQTVTSSAGAAPVLVVGHHSEDTSDTGDLAGSGTFDATSNAAHIRQIVGRKIMNTSPVNFTVDTSANRVLQSGYLSFT